MPLYAVVAPGFSAVYSDWKDVERIRALYPYPKWTKCRTETEAQEFLKRNSYSRKVKQLYNYGDTLNDLYINVEYRIGPDCVYYVIDTRRVGNIRLLSEDALVEYKSNKIFVKIPNIYLSDELLSGHMSAIHNLLHLVGEYVDVNITVPNYAVFYALTVYDKGNNRVVQLTRDAISKRLCKVAFTLKMRDYSDELEEDLLNEQSDSKT